VKHTTVTFEVENFSNFQIFALYLQTMEPQFPDAIRWSMTIRDKIFKMHVAYEDVLKQIPIWNSDNKEMEKRGFGDSKEGVILALRYETFLNSVYSLCESLARVTVGFYPELSQGFRKQRKELLSKKEQVDPQYASIIKSTKWYEEVHSIRSEATHFLSGFTTISKNGEPGYFNKPKGSREGVPFKISVDSVEKHINEIYRSVDNFLQQFGDHFIQKLDPNKRIGNICMKDGKQYVGARGQSLYEFINKQPGICVTPKYECPLRNNCQAYRNALI